MAKKQSSETADTTDTAKPDEAPKEAKKAREPKAKGHKEGKEAAKEPKEKESRAKTKPTEAAQESQAPTETRTEAPKAPPAPGEPTKKKGQAPGVPPRRGKKLRELLETTKQKLAKDGPASVKSAVGMLKAMKRSKFDETVEVHMWLGIDSSQNDQLVRGSVALPHGIGKRVRVLVFCQGENVAKAKEAGADYAGSDEFIQKIQKEGWLEFDVALATQDMMGMVSRLGKVLGPRGLMPTPKSGTVITGDVAAGVREFKAGKVEYRTDKGGNVHAGVGKLSFDEDKLVANINAFVDQVRAVKPSGVKGNYVKSITLSATMSPGIPLTV